MRGYGFMKSHPGLRRVLCVSLVMGLILSTFTGFVYAEEIDEEPVVVAGQIDDQDDQDVDVQDDQDVDVQDDQDVDDQDVDVQDDQDVDDQDIDIQDDKDVDDQDIADDDEITDDDKDVPEDADIEDEALEDDEAPTDEISQDADVEVANVYGRKVLIWTDYMQESIDFTDNIKSRLTGEGCSVTVRTDDSALTAADLSEIDMVYVLIWYQNEDSTYSQSMLASAGILKNYIQNGGIVVLNGDNCNGWLYSQSTIEALSARLGFEFIFSDCNTPYSGSYIFNTEDRADLLAGVTSNFRVSAPSQIITADTSACWDIKSTDDHIFMMDKLFGQGILFVLSDINWLNYAGQSATCLLVNMLNKSVVHKHSFEYSASGADLIATCKNSGCDISDALTLTVKAPAKTVIDDEESEKATLEGLDTFNSYTGIGITEDDILYTGTGSTNYAESYTAPTAVGTYKASITIGGVTASVEYEIEPVKYSFEDAEKSWTKDSNETLSFRAFRNSHDDTTIDHFTGAKVDNKVVEEGNMIVTKGSVIVELKTDLLNTLSVGAHTITFSFDDGDDISMAFIVKAAPKTSPQTGEYAGPAVLVSAMLLLAASSYTGVKVFKKKEN